jgi:hypothetical protein
MHIHDLFEAKSLCDLDADRLYDVFRASYEEQTGAAWTGPPPAPSSPSTSRPTA